MNIHLRAFSRYAGACFLLLFALYFTPFFWLPGLLSLVTEGWIGILFIFGLGGAPFAGFLMLWIVSPRDKYFLKASKLAGMWFGSIVGSIFGNNVVGLT